MPRLEYWSIKYVNANAYRAPEMAQKALSGEVYGHARCPDGQVVVTSDIVKCDKVTREVETRSSSVYTLGKPDPLWLEWLKKEGRPHGEDTFPFFLD